jgi:GNAT superfamily N-acetyltransferase
MSDLPRHSQIPIAFTVRSVLDVFSQPDGLFDLYEREIRTPYDKNYDAVEPPAEWSGRFDLKNWSLLGAYRDGKRIGGAVVAFDTPGVDLLEGRRDLALLWDVRVHPDVRRQGAGAALFCATEQWARKRGCNQIKIETQNVNVAACQFYARQGCVLRRIIPDAYPAFPDEIQLLWYKDLVGDL